MTPEELEEERDFLLKSLRDLDAERAAGDIDESDYRSLRDQYTVRAAEVLRRLDRGTPERAVGTSADAPVRRRARRWVVAAGAVAVAVVAGWAVMATAGERLPGDQLTGNVTEGVTGKLARAQELTAAGRASEAVKLYDEVLRIDPENPQALAYRGWIVHLAGLSDRGLDYVNRAVEADPSYPDARFFRGMILWRAKGDAAAAVTEFQAFLDNDPPPAMVDLVKTNLERARAEAAEATTSTTGAP